MDFAITAVLQELNTTCTDRTQIRSAADCRTAANKYTVSYASKLDRFFHKSTSEMPSGCVVHTPFNTAFFFTSTDAPNQMLPFRNFRLIRCKDHELSMQQRKGDHQLSDISPNY